MRARLQPRLDRAAHRVAPATGRAWSISPLNERSTRSTPVQTMLAETSKAISGSRKGTPRTPAPTAGHHADRGPDVRHQVLAVGLQHDRAVRRPVRNRIRATTKLTSEASERADAQPSRAARGKQADDGVPGDPPAATMRMNIPSRPLEKILDLVVPVGVRFVHRAGGVPQRKVRRHRRHQVDERLGRVGQQADGTGQPVRRPLEDERSPPRRRPTTARVALTERLPCPYPTALSGSRSARSGVSGPRRCAAGRSRAG